MTYEQILEYLYSSTPAFEREGAAAYKPGLGNTLALDAYFSHPHRQYKTIHVAGTNGKGSVSHMLAAILQSQGYRVGLYTSPHMIDFAERIRVNGQPISHEYVVHFVENLIHPTTLSIGNNQKVVPQTQGGILLPPTSEGNDSTTLFPSFFELTTCMAFRYFADMHVDIAVIEVGLGGRLDCTNIITPILSVITNISMDHTSLLGNTLAQIASEKAGIIKPGIPVVIGEATEETRPVFLAKASETQSPIHFAEEEHEIEHVERTDSGELMFRTQHYGSFVSPLSGSYQRKNINTLLCALNILKQQLRIPTSFNPMPNPNLMGRWQILAEHPLTICDTGHNVAAWQYLGTEIKGRSRKEKSTSADGQYPISRTHIVFGMVSDKDIRTVLSLLPKDAFFYWTQADSHRAIPSAEVERLGKEAGLTGQSYNTVGEAYEAAMQQAQPNDTMFIGGSSYVVGNLLAYLEQKKQDTKP